jgi:tetratricopeptide (TPR) repeat protein
VAVVGLATLRNAWVSGEFVLISSQGGVTFYHGNNPRSEGTFAPPPELGADRQSQEAQARSVAERELGRHLSSGEVSTFWVNRGVDYLLSNPFRSIALLGKKVLYFGNSMELSGEYVLAAERCLAPGLRLAFVPFGLFVAVGIFGVPLAHQRDRRLTAIIGAVAAAALLTALVFFTASRYRLIAAAHLAILVAPAFDEAWSHGWRTPRTFPLRTGAALLVMLQSLVPWGDTERFQAAGEFYNLGGEFYARRRTQDAIRYYLTALQLRPRHFDLQFNLAHAYAVEGDLEAAAEHMAIAAELDLRAADASHYAKDYAEKARFQKGSRSPYLPICEL